jgi:hypothetical protein
MRQEARLDPFAQPQHALAERRQPAAAALFHGDERLPDDVGPFRDQAPGLAVGQADLGGSVGDLAGLPDRFEQGEEFGLDRLALLNAGAPYQIEMQGGGDFQTYVKYRKFEAMLTNAILWLMRRVSADTDNMHGLSYRVAVRY